MAAAVTLTTVTMSASADATRSAHAAKPIAHAVGQTISPVSMTDSSVMMSRLDDLVLHSTDVACTRGRPEVVA